MSFDLLILAGGECDPGSWGEGKPKYKALLKFGANSFLDISLASFSALSEIGRRIVVGEGTDIEHIARSYGATTIPPGNGILANLRNALIELQTSPASHLIISTSDMPFMTVASVYSFVKEFGRLKSKLDFVYPIVPVELCSALAPGTRRTSIKTLDGRFTGGNVFLVRRSRLAENIPFLEEVLANRKSPLKLAKMLGLAPVIQVAAGFGRIKTLENMVNRKLTGEFGALITETPEIAIDIDSLAEYEKISAIKAVS